MLELAACPNHADRLVEEFESLLVVTVPIAGIVVAALLDNRLSWRTAGERPGRPLLSSPLPKGAYSG
jgi:hypothetical protein